MTEQAELSDAALAAIQAGRKIDAIKLLRTEQSLDLKEAKDMVDNHIAANPELVAKQSRQGSTSITPLLLAAVVTAAAYFAYKALA